MKCENPSVICKKIGFIDNNENCVKRGPKWSSCYYDGHIPLSSFRNKVIKNGRKEPKFAMDFVGFSGMGSLDQYEAVIALSPDYDLTGVISAVMFEDGSRTITLHFKRSEKKIGRRGYSLEQRWEQTPNKSEIK
jgi:hypothetical protein